MELFVAMQKVSSTGLASHFSFTEAHTNADRFNAVNDALKNAAGQPQALGLVDGNGGQVLNQVIGCAIAWGLAIVGSLVILKICDVLVGLRVSEEDEKQGLDLSQHGEEGYILEA